MGTTFDLPSTPTIYLIFEFLFYLGLISLGIGVTWAELRRGLPSHLIGNHFFATD